MLLKFFPTDHLALFLRSQRGMVFFTDMSNKLCKFSAMLSNRTFSNVEMFCICDNNTAATSHLQVYTVHLKYD
jgi:hypothetical protein